MIRSRLHSDVDDMLEDEDVNPMDSLANLSDAMLVLAVGIMLSLIMAWKVDIGNTAADVKPMESATTIEDDQLVIDGSKDTDTEINDLGLSEYGKVYVDEDGNLYVLREDE